MSSSSDATGFGTKEATQGRHLGAKGRDVHAEGYHRGFRKAVAIRRSRPVTELVRYGYPPGLPEDSTQFVPKQSELLTANEAEPGPDDLSACDKAATSTPKPTFQDVR